MKNQKDKLADWPNKADTHVTTVHTSGLVDILLYLGINVVLILGISHFLYMVIRLQCC